MAITDQGDRKVYLLSGETTGIRPGDRMKLRGRRVKSTGPDKTRLWEAKEVLKEFGQSRGTSGNGVFRIASAPSGSTIGVVGFVESPTGNFDPGK